MTEKIDLSVPNFDRTLTSGCELCIEIGANYFSYTVIDLSTQEVKVLNHKPSTIFSEIEDSILQANFSKTKINLTTQKFTFIPANLFDEKNIDVYAKYINPNEKEEVFTTHLEKAGVTVIYAFPQIILDKISKHFPEATIYPQFVPYFNGVENAYSSIRDQKMFINFKQGFIELIVFINKKFQFYNIFDYENEEELMYFLLLTVQQNRLKPSSTLVKLNGNIAYNGTIFQKIKEQFNQTEIIDEDSLPLNYNGLGHSLMPRFFSLLSLHLCE